MENSAKAASYRIIISGCRNYTNYEFVKRYCDIITKNLDDMEVVCGMCRGVDLLGYRWAEENNIPIKKMKADWKNEGAVAGPNRNQRMADYATHLIAFWNGAYRRSGTYDMIKRAEKNGLKVRVIRIDRLDNTYNNW